MKHIVVGFLLRFAVGLAFTLAFVVLAVKSSPQAPTPIPGNPNVDVFQQTSHLYLLSQVPTVAPLVFVNRQLMCQTCTIPDYQLAGNILTFTGFQVPTPATVQVVFGPTVTLTTNAAVPGVGIAVTPGIGAPNLQQWGIDTATVVYHVAPPTAPGACPASGAFANDAAGYAYFCNVNATGTLQWMRTATPMLSTW
jgi:hypothetical protein